MNRKLTVLLVLGFATASAQFGFLEGENRFLQSGNSTNNGTRKGKGTYGDKPAVNFKSQLGCGACIRGGFIYCVPVTAEGSDPSTWKGDKSVCC